MKRFISGFVTAALLFGSITVFAAGGRTIEVFDTVKKIVVNKVEVPLDSNNKPFAYNGTTYVPLRFISNSLGVPVDWDGQTGTVYLGDTNNKNAKFWETDISHSKWDNYYSTFEYSHGKTNKFIKSNMGNRYSNYLKISTPSAYRYYGEITFPLNGAYSRFNGIIGCTDRYKDGSPEVLLTILLDGREAFKKVIPMGMLEQSIGINTAGALNITFRVEGNQEKESKIEIGIFDGEFIK